MNEKTQVRRVSVVGAGMIGHGIAIALARGNCEVRLIDANEEGLRKGLDWIASDLQVLEDIGIVADGASGEIARKVVGTTDLQSGVEGAEFVFEAIPDILEAKRAVFQDLERYCSDQTIFATTTATFRVREIGSAIVHRERVLGAHWVNPPHIMPLVEVASTDETSDGCMQAMVDLLTATGKKPIRCTDIPGLLNNRLLFALWNEGLKILEQGGASAQDIDDAIRFGFGSRVHFWGPFRWNDFFGNLAQVKTAFASIHAVTGDDAFRPSPLLQRQVDAGHLGYASGKGWYDYQDQQNQPIGVRRAQMLGELAQWYRQNGLL